MDTSKFKSQTSLSSSSRGSSQGQDLLEEAQPPLPSPASKDFLGISPGPGTLKKRGSRPSSRENFISLLKGPQQDDVLNSKTQELRSSPPSQKSSVIPNNIRHKFGSQEVDQLVFKEQVSMQGPGG